jgi:copper chaperone CopZ
MPNTHARRPRPLASFLGLARRGARLGVAPALAACAVIALPVGCASPGSTTAPGVVRTADSIAFPVEGMACPNCAKEIEHALSAVPGVRGASVDFKSSRATVTLAAEHPATLAQLESAVDRWRKEHFAEPEDANCLDPAKRKELQQQAR